jgi:tRNA pseudouridine synthase 10
VEAREPVVDEKIGFSLCKVCAVRQGTDSAGFELVKDNSCFICRGLTSRIATVGEKVIRGAKRYQFKTFSIGMILSSGVQEREDQLRSDLRIRGRTTVKSELTGEIADLVGRRMHKKVDRLHPELTVLVNLDSDTVEMAAKSFFIHGRYTKPRGVSQRRMLCDRCEGTGCNECDAGYAKIPSVETAIGDRFLKLLRSPKIKFTWLGSEDPDSVVFPPGRPFVLEVKSPMRHEIPVRMVLRTGRGTVKVTGLRRLHGKPSSIPAFTFKTRAFLESEVPVKPTASELRSMRNSIVQYRNNKGKTVHKKVYQLRIITARGRRLTVEIKLDGGLPVKRLINGDSVSPSLAEVLKTPLNCQRFDILRVWESGGFEFGKV